MQKWCALFGLGLVCLLAGQRAAAAAGKVESIDTRLRRAEAFVAGSDKYLHQSKLRRGMTGYGLTVLAGAKIEKFNATVISVMRNWWPHQDVIICRLSGLGLAKTGIIAGMSGSPVYITDPADGKHKMIGALAYAWSFQKEPICGIQPIVQMLAVQGVDLPGEPAAKGESAAATHLPGTSRQASKVELDEDFARAFLVPEKIDFSTLVLSKRRSRSAGLAGNRSRYGALRRDEPRLIPLATPVMVAGAEARTIELAESLFAGTGLVPVRAGSVGGAEAAAAGKIKLAPGSSVSIPLISGDMNWASIGTVTDVIGDRVLAFGHAMFAEGPLQVPMSTAYVHTIIPSMRASFKLSSTLKVTGAVTHDEHTGVVGQVGKTAKMVPMTVTCLCPTGRQKFKYNLIRHRRLTAYMAEIALLQSVVANRSVPQRHTIEYAVDVEFEKFGRYRAANVGSGSNILPVLSDLTRPLAALMNTPLGKPVFPKSINATVTIHPVQKTAEILSVKLDRNVYKPGEEVTGRVTLRPFRAERATKAVSLTLPDDLPDGRYTLTACNAAAIAAARQREMPHRFRPRTVEQLFAAIKDVVEPRADRLYVRLPLPGGGLAVRKNELEHLPASMAELLWRAAPTDTNTYRRSKIVSFRADYVLNGQARAKFEVKKHSRRTN